jgi:N-acetylmuramoyl-L-alanine amidase
MMASVRLLPPPGARPVRAAWVACTGLIVVLCLPAAAQPPSTPGDTYDDPLAWRRIDAGAPELPVLVDDLGAGRTRRLTGRRLLLGAEEVYLRSADVADMFGARRVWQDAVQRLTLELAAVSVRVTAGSRLVVVGQEERLLPVPVLAAEGELWLPMILVTDVLAARAGQIIRWNPAVLHIDLGSLDANVTGLEVMPYDGGTTVTVICDQPLGFRASHADQGLVEIKIYDGRVDPTAVALEAAQGLVRSVRSRQEDGYAVVAIQLEGIATGSRTEAADGGRRIVMTVEDQRLGALPEPEPRGQAHVAVEAQRPEVSSSLRITTVVLDPGHGGDDAGVVGPSGSREKDVNLDVARALARYLRQEGDLEVVLTRDDDRSLELADRAEIANRAGGDLFVSVHCNGWFDRDAAGLETYFLSPAKTNWSKSVEQAENQSALADDVEFIVWELVQNKFISSSSELAEVVQHEACVSLGLPDRGVKQAGFRVLVGAYMPAILVEVGFLSNPTEETLLLSRDYQQHLARAIGDAILTYRERQVRADAAGAAAGGRP